MSYKFVRKDDPSGERGGHGARWKLASAERGGAVEVYGLKSNPPGLRISVMDYRSGTNTPDNGCVCMDPESATEFANEILRLVRVVKAHANGVANTTGHRCVDGSGLCSPEHERSLVTSLAVSNEALDRLSAELRNALVPAHLHALKGNVEKALPGIERVLALAKVLAEAANLSE